MGFNLKAILGTLGVAALVLLVAATWIGSSGMGGMGPAMGSGMVFMLLFGALAIALFAMLVIWLASQGRQR